MFLANSESDKCKLTILQNIKKEFRNMKGKYIPA